MNSIPRRRGSSLAALRDFYLAHDPQKGLTIFYFTFSHTSVVMLILPSRAFGAGCVV